MNRRGLLAGAAALAASAALPSVPEGRRFVNASGDVGAVRAEGSLTSYGVSSDTRLMEPLEGALYYDTSEEALYVYEVDYSRLAVQTVFTWQKWHSVHGS